MVCMNTVHQYRLRNLRFTLLLIGLVIAVTLSIGYGGKQAEAFTCDPTEHIVQYGDTLWAIAEKYCDGNIQHATDKLVRVYGTNIQLGERIYLPINQNCDLVVTNKGQVYENC